jgi:hypothetical protein
MNTLKERNKMPNWCANVLELTHDDPAMIDRARKALEDDRFCDEFAPLPEALKETTAPSKPNDRLINETGYSDWYSHNVAEWGTKWDFGSSDMSQEYNGHLHASFDTAWGPPLALMEKLEQQGFGVHLEYYEPGMNFCGIYEDGFDESWECQDAPDEVKDFWNIEEIYEEEDDLLEDEEDE